MRRAWAYLCIPLLALHGALAADYETLLPPMNGQASDFAVRRAGQDAAASIKLAVTSEGIYQVSFAALTNAGMTAAELRGDALRLYCRTQELAMYVSSSSQWASNDFLLFYGRGFDGEYSKTNAYWLGWGTSARRMPAIEATPQPAWPLCTTAVATVTYKREYYYTESYRPNDADINHWFALELAHTYSTNVQFFTPQPVSNGVAFVDLTLYGFLSVESVSPNHCTRVGVSGVSAANVFYDGDERFLCRTNIPAYLLRDTTTVSFTQILQPSVPADYAYLKKCELTYQRHLTANGPQLFFDTTPGSNTYRVAGLAASPGALWAFDVSAPDSVTRLSSISITNNGAICTCTFSLVAGPTGRVAVVDASAFKSCDRIERVWFRDLGDVTRRVDYIVICPDSFREQVYRVLKRKHLQGLRVAVAPLRDVYNEFGYGVTDAAALKQFLGYAFHHWSNPAPRYLLLAGTGSRDPLARRYPSPEMIPVHMNPSPFKWTASDAWFVQVHGTDAVPDYVLGRIPISNETQLASVLDKVAAFENMPSNSWVRQEGLLVADQTNDVFNFKVSSQTLRSRCALFGDVVYLDDTIASICRSSIQATINSGVLAVNYFGHGATDRWSGKNIFDANLVKSLSNTQYPIFTMVTCHNGLFYNAENCLVETVLATPGKGGSACLASPGLLNLAAGEVIAAGFYTNLYNESAATLGDAVAEAYLKLAEDMGFQSAELSYFQLFGDPGMKVNSPP